MTAPALAPATQWMGTPSSTSTFNTPIWAQARIPPAPRARPIREGPGSRVEGPGSRVKGQGSRRQEQGTRNEGGGPSPLLGYESAVGASLLAPPQPAPARSCPAGPGRTGGNSAVPGGSP